MINSVFSRTLYSRWKSTLIWSLSLFIFALLFAALFQSFSSDIEELALNYPESMQAFVGDISNAATPEGWLGIELYSLFLPLSLAIIGVSFGAAAIGKEEDSGTLELILASPISRRRILFEKALAITSQLAIVALAVWIGVVVGSLFFPFDVSLSTTFWATFMAWMLGVFFGFASLAAQAVSGRRGFALGVGSALLGGTYFVLVVSKLVNSLEFIKYVSPFHYYDGQVVLIEGPNFINLLIFLVASSTLYFIAHFGFASRDTGV